MSRYVAQGQRAEELDLLSLQRILKRVKANDKRSELKKERILTLIKELIKIYTEETLV